MDGVEKLNRRDVAGLLLYLELSDAGGQLEYVDLVERLGLPEEQVGEYVDEMACKGYAEVSGGVVTLTIGDYV